MAKASPGFFWGAGWCVLGRSVFWGIAATWSGTAFAQPRSVAYRYDALGQLTDVEPGEGSTLGAPGSPVPAEAFTFAYDPLGNRRTASRGPAFTETYTFNTLNQYTGVAVAGAGPPQLPPRNFTYDEDGNLTGDEQWTYHWDAENRLIRQEARSGTSPRLRLDFTYDHQGRRVTKHVYTLDASGNPTGTQSALLFRYDEWNLVAELDLTAPYEPSLLRSYTWGPDLSGTLAGSGGIGGLLAVTTHGDNPSTAYPCYDGSGNITQWLDAAGAVVARAEYGPYGEIFRQDSAAPAPFGFSTKYTDAETGLLYYGYRYYDPRAGRWINRDPLEEQGGINLYGFNHNNPLSCVDPDGRSPHLIWGAVLGAGGDIAAQMLVEHRSFKEIKWGRVVASAALGAATGGISAIEGMTLKVAGATLVERVAVQGGILYWGVTAEVMMQNVVENRDPTEGLVEAQLTALCLGGAGEVVGPLLRAARRGLQACKDPAGEVIERFAYRYRRVTGTDPFGRMYLIEPPAPAALSAAERVTRKAGTVFDELALQATKNGDAPGVVLGKHNARRFGGEPYNSVAFNKKMTYFELDNWDDLYARFGDDVWEINKSFLDQQWKAGKEFYFSHNPWNASILGGAGNSFEKEVSHLIYLGVKDFVPSGNGLWRAVR